MVQSNYENLQRRNIDHFKMVKDSINPTSSREYVEFRDNSTRNQGSSINDENSCYKVSILPLKQENKKSSSNSPQKNIIDRKNCNSFEPELLESLYMTSSNAKF